MSRLSNGQEIPSGPPALHKAMRVNREEFRSQAVRLVRALAIVGAVVGAFGYEFSRPDTGVGKILHGDISGGLRILKQG